MAPVSAGSKPISLAKAVGSFSGASQRAVKSSLAWLFETVPASMRLRISASFSGVTGESLISTDFSLRRPRRLLMIQLATFFPGAFADWTVASKHETS